MVNNIVRIFDVPFINIRKKDIVEVIHKRIKYNQKTYIVTANAEITMRAKENVKYFNIIKKADYIVPDGVGVVKGAKLLKQEIYERVPGIELMVDLLEISNQFGYSVYFYGAKQENLEKLIINIKKDYPNINIVGYKNGYINDEDNSITNEIINLKPDCIFVAKGSPMQDEWIDKVLPKVEKGLFMGVGGSFDVLCGAVNRAPKIWRRLNLEWLYRMIVDPKRLKRSSVYPKFVLEILKEMIKSRKG